MPKPITENTTCAKCPHQSTCEVDKAMARAEQVINENLLSAESVRLFKLVQAEMVKGTEVPAGVELRWVDPVWRLVSTNCQMAQRQAALIENQQQMAALKRMRENAEAFAKRRHGS